MKIWFQVVDVGCLGSEGTIEDMMMAKELLMKTLSEISVSVGSATVQVIFTKEQENSERWFEFPSCLKKA